MLLSEINKEKYTVREILLKATNINLPINVLKQSIKDYFNHIAQKAIFNNVTLHKM